jgi:hypothetical protein
MRMNFMYAWQQFQKVVYVDKNIRHFAEKVRHFECRKRIILNKAPTPFDQGPGGSMSERPGGQEMVVVKRIISRLIFNTIFLVLDVRSSYICLPANILNRKITYL